MLNQFLFYKSYIIHFGVINDVANIFIDVGYVNQNELIKKINVLYFKDGRKNDGKDMSISQTCLSRKI